MRIPAAGALLDADLTLPDTARGVVVFAHGAGSGRRSPRNRAVAARLQTAGLGTLMFDLLTPDEERDRRNVFDIGLLAWRLGEATGWLRETRTGVPVGYFGASTGAAAALVAAADPESQIQAVVSRGGRPDLAAGALPRVRAPTLLIVGEMDPVVLRLNRVAARELTCETRLEIVPGATHLFEEPGTLEVVAVLAAEWFARNLVC